MEQEEELSGHREVGIVEVGVAVLVIGVIGYVCYRLLTRNRLVEKTVTAPKLLPMPSATLSAKEIADALRSGMSSVS